MTDRLTDEQVADCAKPDSNYLVGLLAREVQAYRTMQRQRDAVDRPEGGLTDERLTDLSRNVFCPDEVADMADELIQYRALRADCPTCGGSGAVEGPERREVVTDERGEPCGETLVDPRIPCPDCTDGKMPLDKWVALLVEDGERQAEVIAA